MRRSANPRLISFHRDLHAGLSAIEPGEGHEIWREHGMDAWIVNLTVAGAARVNHGADRFTVGPGELLLFAPEVVHDYGPEPADGRWHHWWIYFVARPAWLELLDWPRVTRGVQRLRCPDALLPRLTAIFDEVVQHHRGHLRRGEALALARVEELLLWCDTLNPGAGRALDERVGRACAFLCDRHRERITLARLARACGLSSSRLSHLFRAETGQTPMEYLEVQRIARARDLLTHSAKPIAAIAAAVGFQDPLYFSRVFRRHASMSPRAWRKKAR
ncbi:MAG TPA: arabinose operon transcriptional regulator AraC [Planctomycetota bacterium]|nr:arabinose operon transcriptional regulator AraC [Planctomycetota bacterium]